MPLEDKIEAVRKVSAAMEKPQGIPEQELERLPANKDHFQMLFDATQISQQRSMSGVPDQEKIDPFYSQPIAAEERATPQRSSSSTDQESKHQNQGQTAEGAVGSVSASDSGERLTPSSLMEEVGKLGSQVSKASKLSTEGLRNQAKSLIAQIDVVKGRLAEAEGEIKPSYQTLLKNRLTHVNENLKIALTKAGVEYTPPPEAVSPNSGTVNPIERFLGFLTQSQYQIRHLEQTMNQVTNTPLSPATMFALQIKVGYVQQQLELFTSLLNKALESTKTIMNVQV